MVAVICLGLGGLHLLLKYGQFVEAEPAVVGQPINVRGRFFRLFAEDDKRYYTIDTDRPEFHMRTYCVAGNSWWWLAIAVELDGRNNPGEYTLTLTPEGGSTIRGANFFVRAAD